MSSLVSYFLGSELHSLELTDTAGRKPVNTLIRVSSPEVSPERVHNQFLPVLAECEEFLEGVCLNYSQSVKCLMSDISPADTWSQRSPTRVLPGHKTLPDSGTSSPSPSLFL